ncbi:MAG: NUDIX domain-containing protein [Planctomycetes bacterium]|nr:NUDIX domain-containing protein [Planctomycetota bacterium]
MAGRIAVVDDANAFLRWEDRRTIHVERLVHRSIQVMLFDTQGRLVVQRRHRDKQTHPSTWDLSCAGHVEESDYPAGPDDDLDRVYAEVAAREVEEELGVTPQLVELGHFPPEPGVHYEQIRLFRGTSDGPFTLQPDEVEELTHLAPADFDAFAAREPVTEALRYFVRWARANGVWT